MLEGPFQTKRKAEVYPLQLMMIRTFSLRNKSCQKVLNHSLICVYFQRKLCIKKSYVI